MRSRMIQIAAGFVVALLQPQLFYLPYVAIILLNLLILLPFLTTKKRLGCVFFVGAYLFINLLGAYQLGQRLPDIDKRTDWHIEGVVADLPREQGDLIRFVLDITSIQKADARKSNAVSMDRVRLAWYEPSFDISLGDSLSLTARLKPPHGLSNPQGFDYEHWLLAQGIDATGYIRGAVKRQAETQSALTLLRLRLGQTIDRQFPNPQTRALFRALTIGDKTYFSEQDWHQLRHSGVIHLAVISGLHIGFMAICGWGIGRLCSGLCLNFRAHYLFPAIGALSIAAAYLLVSGLGIPAQRAFIMLAVFLLAGVGRFCIDHWTRWWIALVIVLAFNPWSLFSVGLWLSFAAVALLIWVAQNHRGWRMAGQMQIMLMVGMLPLYFFFFSGVSLIAPLFNLLAIPYFSILVPLLFIHLALSGFGIEIFKPLMELAAQLFWYLLELNQQFPQGFIEVDPPTNTSLFLLIVAALGLLLQRFGAMTWVWLLLLVPAFSGPRSIPEQQGLQVWVYDVGQGLSVLVKIDDYRLLYDTGPAYKSGNSALSRELLPHWQSQRIQHIDHLVVSHSDNDHAGGIKDLLQAVSIDKITTSYPYEKAQACAAGQEWRVKGAVLKFLAGGKGGNNNDRSCVLLVEAYGCRLLLPGDISSRIERGLLGEIDRPIDWLVAAHHGSKTSTSSEFLVHLSPKVVVFSAGYANPFGHPHPKVVERVQKRSLDYYNTAEHGAVRLFSSEKGCMSSNYRKLEPRLWR